MSTNLVISPHPAAFFYHHQLPFTLHPEPIRSSLFLGEPKYPLVFRFEDAERNSRRGTNTASRGNSTPYLAGGFVEDAWFSSRRADTRKGKPDLNGFFILAGGVELESNWSCNAVTLRFWVRPRQAAITHFDDTNRRSKRGGIPIRAANGDGTSVRDGKRASRSPAPCGSPTSMTRVIEVNEAASRCVSNRHHDL